jgi:uncharacterized membrane protein
MKGRQMNTSPLLMLLAFSVIASALVSGVFLAFSELVMRSLHKAERSAGIEAMQIINREVFKTMFMVLLIGMAVVSAALIGLGWIYWQSAASYWMIAGGVVYLLITFVVTLVGNVPLNNKLDGLAHADPQTAIYWSDTFYKSWTFFNHVRTLGAGVAACCFLLACLTYGTS